jgi:hypothetical protein
VKVIGVATGGLYGEDDATQLTRFVEQTMVTFPVGWDETQSHLRYPRSDAISPFPLDVVVDRDGNIAYLSREFDPAAMRAVVERLLQE